MFYTAAAMNSEHLNMMYFSAQGLYKLTELEGKRITKG